MGGIKLSKFFENYLTQNPIFLNKKSLQSNYTPESTPHREEQVEELATILAPALRMEKPSNVFKSTVFPEPFGPTMEVIGVVKSNAVFLANDLKPESSRDFRYIR